MSIHCRAGMRERIRSDLFRSWADVVQNVRGPAARSRLDAHATSAPRPTFGYNRDAAEYVRTLRRYKILISFSTYLSFLCWDGVADVFIKS